MVSFSQANKLYNEGKYQEALVLYRELQGIYGESVVSGNIQRCLSLLKKGQEIEEKEKNSLRGLIQQVDRYFKTTVPLTSKPLVSVIMTSHNTEKYIESAIYSIIDQSYENLEVIVVDDCSTDKTIQILDRLSRSNKKIKYFRLNSNLGTYYAKNLGILRSKGEILFFHDSDDICHKNRIEICVKALQSNPQAVAVRAAYTRVDPSDGSIVEVDGHTYKLGLITLGIKREVFNKIGFFNCTTRASDDELFNRIKAYFKKSGIVDVAQPLYFNTMRRDSLIADMVDWNGEKSIKQKASLSRGNYVKVFSDFHKNSTVRFADKFIFPTIRDILPVDDSMTKLANPKLPVYINVCSIPEREEKLRRVVNALYNQCDFIHVYLDGYKKIPEFLKNDNKITVLSCNNKKESLRDNGKFILLEKLVKENKDGYYFTVDDDINYPVDYVNTLLKKLNFYNDKVVLGVHGVLLPVELDRYFSTKRKVLSFYRQLEDDKLVNILGTGTTAFRIGAFDGFSLSDFIHTGMADVFFAIECKKRNLLQIAISRYDNWISEMESDTPTLFTEFKNDDLMQTSLILKNNIKGNVNPQMYSLPKEVLDKLPNTPVLSFYQA